MCIHWCMFILIWFVKKIIWLRKKCFLKVHFWACILTQKLLILTQLFLILTIFSIFYFFAKQYNNPQTQRWNRDTHWLLRVKSLFLFSFEIMINSTITKKNNDVFSTFYPIDWLILNKGRNFWGTKIFIQLKEC